MSVAAPPAPPSAPGGRNWSTGFDRLPLTGLHIAHEYARPLRPGWVDQLRKEWDDLQAGPLIVSLRPDRRYYIIAGGHRYSGLWSKLDEQQRKETYVDCYIYVGLTLKQEAIIFHSLDTQRLQHSAGDQVPAQRLMDDRRILDIDRILATIPAPGAADPLFIDLLPRRGDHNVKAIGAISALQRCYDMAGPVDFERALRVIYDAWIDPPAPIATPQVRPYTAESLRAVTGVVARFCRPDVRPYPVVVEDLVDALRIVTPTGFKATVLQERAKSMNAQAGQGERTLMLALLGVYNAHLRSKRQGRRQVDLGLVMTRVPWYHSETPEAPPRNQTASQRAHNEEKRRRRAEERKRRAAQEAINRAQQAPGGSTGPQAGPTPPGPVSWPYGPQEAPPSPPAD